MRRPQRADMIVTAADDLFAMPVAAMLCSALAASESPDELRPVVIDVGLSARGRRRIAASVPSVDIVEAPIDRLQHWASMCASSYPPASFATLVAPELVADRLTRRGSAARKIVMLDADMIVRSDLAELFQACSGAAPLWATRDYVAWGGRFGGHEELELDDLGLDPALPYLNAGVCVVDVDTWIDEDTTEHAGRLIDRIAPRLRFPDQDVLNILFAERWAELPPSWNQLTGVHAIDAEIPGLSDAELSRLRHDPDIVHFNDRPKPWQRTCTHPGTAGFFEAVDRTDWAGWRPTRRSDAALAARKVCRRAARAVAGS